VGEARALDEAAAMLDSQRLPDGVLQDIASENQDHPAPHAEDQRPPAPD
jgi:hypothetical protein